MTIFGKRLSDYIQFSKPFLVLILVVGIARLALSLGGAPNSTARWLSMSVAVWIGILYYSVRVHTSGFGSYKHLLGVVASLNVVAQAVAIVAIIIAIFSGNPNIFSAPEYAFGGDGATWLHVGAHLFVGTTVGSLVGWAFGCLIMFLSRKMLTGDKNRKGAVRA